MKSRLLYLFTALTVLFANALLAQCPTGDVTLISQADVNVFAEGNPSCTAITGNLIIGNSSISNITDLSPLENITSVSGYIKIDNLDSLTTLSGLGNITSVGGYISVYGCDALTSLTGLDNLTSVGKLLSIQGNDALTSLTGLNKLTSTGGLSIGVNGSLTSLTGLENLVTVRDLVVVDGNNSLTSLTGLDNLTYVGGDLSIKRNYTLTSLSVLENLTYAKNELQILENTALTSLQGIHNIELNDITFLTIALNSNLSFCDMPNICSYLESNKRRTISGNSGRCSTEGELRTACLPEVVSVTLPANVITECGSPLQETDLPANLTVIFDDNTSGTATVNWDIADYDGSVGSITLTGTLDLMGQATNPDSLMARLTVIVKDTQAPVADIPDLPVLRGICSVTVSDIPTATDLCSGTVSAATDDPLQYDNQGTYTITWTYSDDHGNPLTQEQTVIVEEAIPILQCPESYIVSCDPVIHFDLPVATDQCGTVRVIQTDHTGLTSGSAFPTGVTKLTYRASNTAGSVYCSIEVEILPRLEINHVTGVANGDTIHLADCLPPRISRNDLELGPHQKRASILSRMLTEENTSYNQHGMWKVLSYEYEVTDYCGSTGAFQNYVALYDLAPPVFQNFPQDVTIASADDLPPVSEEVRITDICRYVVWDTVTTTPIVDSGNGDTLVYVRRWMAEDESGNKSFRDQMIYVAPDKSEAFGGITAHMAKESDLVHARFPNMAGTNGVPVTLFRVDSITGSTTKVHSQISGNWQGQYGKVFFTPIQSGLYQLKVEVPTGYTVVHADSLFTADGWSDTLSVTSDANLSLGAILLLPVPDTVQVDTVLLQAIHHVNSLSGHETTMKTFTLYPNPTTGSVKINGLQSGNFDYTIYNHLGQIVKSGSNDHGTEIDLSNQLNGMYFIRVRSGNQDWGSRQILLMGG